MPLSFTTPLRSKSCASLVQSETASVDGSPATSTSTNASDTSEYISVYDPSDVDPFKRDSTPPSASRSHFTDESLYPLSDASFSPASPGAMLFTPLMPSARRSMDTPEDTSRFYLPRNDRRLARRPPSSYFSGDSSDDEQKQRSVAEHNQVQSKIQRVFELAKAGGLHLKEMMALKSDIEEFFRRTPGVVTDSDSTDSVPGCPSPIVYRFRCANEYPFPVMPTTPSPNALGVPIADDEPLVDEERAPRREPSQPSPAATSDTSIRPSKIPRMHLAPLMIVKKPTLSSVAACTMSPTPSQTSVRPGPLLRSFSAPTLFSGRERSPTTSVQPGGIPQYIQTRMTSYIPVVKQDVSGKFSPTKIDVTFDFESPGGKEQPRSRFSSSTILPASRRGRWYKPKFTITDSAKVWSFNKPPKVTTPGPRPLFQDRLPPVSETTESFSKHREGVDSLPFKCGLLGRGHIASGRWSTDWDRVVSRIGRDEVDKGEAAMVLHNPSLRNGSPSGDQKVGPVGLLMPRGAAQVRKGSRTPSPESPNRRTGGVFNGFTLPFKAPHPPDGSYGPSAPNLQTTNRSGCQVHLPTMLDVLGGVIDEKRSSGLVRMLPVASRLSRTSSFTPRSRIAHTPLTLKRPPESTSKIPTPMVRSSSYSGVTPRGEGRASLRSSIGGLLVNFPEPPIMKSTSRLIEGFD